MSDDTGDTGEAQKNAPPFWDRRINNRLPLVYVYELPPRFNRELIECYTGAPAEGPNAGYGRSDGDLGGLPLFATEQFLLEAVFHARLLGRRELLTDDPMMADLFYVPYYAHLAFKCLRRKSGPNTPPGLLPFFPDEDQADAQFSQASSRLDDDLWDFLGQRPWLARKSGRDHVIVLGAIGSEVVSPVGCKFGADRRSANFTMGAFESPPEVSFRPPQRRILPVPYPSGLHCKQSYLCGVPDTDRRWLALFVGNPRREPEREAIMANLAGASPEEVLIEDVQGTPDFLQRNRHFFELMGNATFCLQPPGDSPTRKGFFDALLAGCVPVVFKAHHSALGFPDDLPFRRSLPLSPEAFVVVVDDPAACLSKLRAIAQDSNRLSALREAGRQVAWHLQYAMPNVPEGGDAVDGLLSEAIDALSGASAASV